MMSGYRYRRVAVPEPKSTVVYRAECPETGEIVESEALESVLRHLAVRITWPECHSWAVFRVDK